jgi:hypothetical protein
LKSRSPATASYAGVLKNFLVFLLGWWFFKFFLTARVATMFIAPSMTSHEKSSAVQSSRSKTPSAHALRQMALTERVSAISELILSPEALAARKVATWSAEMCANGPAAELGAPPRVAALRWESMEGGTGRRALMSRSSQCETR